tara:strand:+ start:120 stop:893 length:774 start_codon:yes stop_codon:yes gene_type:complete
VEINLNCDLGEKSIHYDGKNDSSLLKIINSASIACGYHAGDTLTINNTIKEAKKNHVSIGAHPGFKDSINFGRKRINLSIKEIKSLIFEQLVIIDNIAKEKRWPLTHVKPHGALNNMACENYEISWIIGKTIQEYDPNLIYIVLPATKMEKAAKKLNIKYACEIFADRNYDDFGNLISRSNQNASVNNKHIAAKNILEMLETSSIKCFSGKKIKCEIDTICIHGDGLNALSIVEELKKQLLKEKFKLLPLNKLSKFI